MKINGKSDGGRQPVVTGLSVTENGRYTAPAGVDGYSPVDVDVDVDPELEDKTINENGIYSADEGYDGLGQVTVDVQPSLQDKVANENGAYTPDEGYYGLGLVEVDVQPTLQDKNITENGTYSADEGYDGLGQVNVDVHSADLIDLSVSANGIYLAQDYSADGFYGVTVDVPQEGYTEKELTEKNFTIVNLNNNASYVGDYAFQNNSTLQTVNLPNASYVGSGAFINCPSLSSISLPECVSIMSQAFQSCSSLRSVSLPECQYISDYAFGYCHSLSSINLPECVNIGNNAFYSCYSLQSVNLPKCLSVSHYAFNKCSSLQSINLPECQYISSHAFENCSSLQSINLPECVSIMSQAFQSCYSLQSVNLPKCLSVNSSVFRFCSSLQSVSLPECLNIAYTAFEGCSNLSSINLPKCNIIGNYGFLNCISLSIISLPKCSNIGNSAFQGCSSLSQVYLTYGGYNIISYATNMLSGTPLVSGVGSIYVPAGMYDKYVVANGWSSISGRLVSYGDPVLYLSYSNGLLYGQTEGIYSDYSQAIPEYNSVTQVSLPECTTLGINVFANKSRLQSVYMPKLETIETGNWNNTGFISCYSLTTVNLPSLKNIPYYAFHSCSSLQEANFPNVSHVGECAFQLCSSLQSVNLPKVTRIDQQVFYSCFSLQSISLPECVSIGGMAFYNCINLSTVNLSVCSYISNRAFQGCNKLETVILGYDGGVIPFTQSMFTASIHNFYVPASLVDSYKTATGWSSYSSRIFPILPDLSYSDGLVYGWASGLESTYIQDYSLGITPSDVTGLSMSFLTELGQSTFAGHYNLTTVDTPNLGGIASDCFNGCSALSNLTAPAISYISDRAFMNCVNLSSIDLGNYNGIIPLGQSVFEGCVNLDTITVPFEWEESYKQDPNWASLSDKIVGTLPYLAFKNGTLLGSISQSINRQTWQSVVGTGVIQNVFLPNCVGIADSTFQNCGSITSVNLSACRYVGGIAFQNCVSLESIELPTAAYVSGAFVAGCTNLTTVKLPHLLSYSVWFGNAIIQPDAPNVSTLYLATEVYGVPTYTNIIGGTKINQGIGSVYVNANTYSKYLTAPGWSSISSIIIPVGDPDNTMLSISDGVLYGNTKAIWGNFKNVAGITGDITSSINLPECITIGTGAFSDNIKSVSMINIPKCEYIGSNALTGAFQSSPTYVNIDLPVCSYIGQSAFFWAKKLQTITLRSNSVCYLGTFVFSEADDLQSIYVPASLVDSYKTAQNWTSLANKIFPITE